jgi:hypothetical protein
MISLPRFLTGEPLSYVGYDGVEYVASVTRHKQFPSGLTVSVARADGKPVTVAGRTYPAGYVVGHGEVTARNMHLNATRESAITPG